MAVSSRPGFRVILESLARSWKEDRARVEESGLGLIAGYAYSAPYEDLKVKAR